MKGDGEQRIPRQGRFRTIPITHPDGTISQLQEWVDAPQMHWFPPTGDALADSMIRSGARVPFVEDYLRQPEVIPARGARIYRSWNLGWRRVVRLLAWAGVLAILAGLVLLAAPAAFGAALFWGPV